jgi:PAS domain S-box-containing protein
LEKEVIKTPMNPKKILLVDDDSIIASLQIQSLNEKDYLVIHASCGEDALELCNSNISHIDLILMDIDLGQGIDGTTAAEQILKKHNIPLIFVSSHTEKEVVEKTEQITNYGYVTKNSGITVLDASIKMAFKLFEMNQKVVAAKDKLAATLDALPDLFFEVGLDGTYYDFHSPRNELLYIPIENLRGKKIQEVMPPVVSEIVMAGIREAHEKGFSVGKQFELDVPAGKLWFEISISRTREATSNNPHFIVLSRDITDRKKAEKELAEKERFARTVTNNIPAMIGYWTKDLICTFANPAYLDWFGRTPEQLLGIKMRDLMSEELYQKVQPHVQGALAGKNQKFEITINKLNGQTSHLLVQYIADKVDGGVNGIYALVTDITEVKERENLIQESEEKWRTLFEVLPVGISLLGTDHSLSEFNSTLTRILDITPQGMLEGKYNHRKYYDSNGKLIPPEKFPSIKAVKEQITISSFEMRFEKEDGKSVWVEIIASPMHLKDYDCVVVTSDVTKRKEAEEQLRKLSRAIEQSESSIIITDRVGNIEYVNRKSLETSGYSMEELIGKNPRILQSGNTPKEEYNKLWGTVLAKGEWIGEFQNKKKSGEIYWESVHISAILSEIGEITNFLAVKEDITYKKSMEEQLRQSQKLESLGQISGGIAHDFNNILAILMGNLELIARKLPADNTSLLKKVEASLSAVDRGAQLTKKLLAFARKQVFSREIVDLNSIIREMYEVLERVLGKQIQIHLEISELPILILIDKNEMENVILNLAINARDAMDNSGTLTIRTRKVENIVFPMEEVNTNFENQFAEFSIIDTGAGIPTHLLQKVFEPFFTTKPKGKGTGLGLSLTYGFVKQSDGHIHVYSEEGKGTCFRLYFPIVNTDRNATTQPIPRLMDNRSDKNTEAKSKTILLVDDETSMLNIANSILSDMGYSILTASNASEAVDILKSHAVDLVISDIIMPGEMNGITLAKYIKENFPNVKTILTSGFPGHLRKTEVHELNQYAFIEKPYKMKDLENLVRIELA